ncbi:MAG TPA: tRNA 5'-guanylyltransferase [Methanophagales archaeon]|nr:tRNA 5'-guanylyltransferase [Methanophagales archaeon]
MKGQNQASRDRAIYAEMRAIPPLFVRADGRNFKRLLSTFEKPYDEKFAKGMVKAAEILFLNSGFNPELAYIFSDEISLLFDDVPFKGRVEKLDSIIASFLASALTIILNFKDTIAFDARVIPVCGGEDVLEYLAQRQAEAWRNHINAYGYYGLRDSGLSENEAEKRLKGMKAADVHEMLFRIGINLNETPKWQGRGILIAKQRYEKEGYDPKLAQKVTATRYKVVSLWDLPIFRSEEGRNLIAQLVDC